MSEKNFDNIIQKYASVFVTVACYTKPTEMSKRVLQSASVYVYKTISG